MPGSERGVGYMRLAWRRFVKSLKITEHDKPNPVGRDYMGNQYFEIPARPSEGVRRPKRWYDPPSVDHFDRPLPPEWFAWVHLRRDDPPTDEEIRKNLELMKQKKEYVENQKQSEQQPNIGVFVEGGQFPQEKKTIKGHKLHDEYVKRGDIIEGETSAGFPVYRDLEPAPGVASRHATEEDLQWFEKQRKMKPDKEK